MILLTPTCWIGGATRCQMLDGSVGNEVTVPGVLAVLFERVAKICRRPKASESSLC